LGVIPVVKQIDTLAAEFPAQTNYLYVTYSGDADDTFSNKSNLRPSHHSSDSPIFVRRPRALSTAIQTLEDKKERGVIVLGCGAYCIGSSVEFDWCAVSCVRQLRRDGFRSIIINYNPETVSTDYDESDVLYFEELSLERVLDIYEREAPSGVVVSVGGQIPNNLAYPLTRSGVTILGTQAQDIDRAEDRRQFSDMLDALSISQPAWSVLSSTEDAVNFADDVGFPVLVRPSFVLSGAAMRVAADASQLRNFLALAADVGNDKPVVVTKFIVNAKEIEFDAVANQGVILNYAIGEHLENAGVHSGDATVVLPAQKLYVKTIRQVKRYASAIAKGLRITGPFNIQFMAKGNNVQVIECNLRASRTFPFVSKTFNHNFISLATQAMVGLPVTPFKISLLDIDYVCVKAPIFSFTRLRGADPALGVEMSSTGEVACFGEDTHEAFLQSMLSTTFQLPPEHGAILLSIASEEFRREFAEAAVTLAQCGFVLYATSGTAAFYLAQYHLAMTVVSKPSTEADDGPGSALDLIKHGKVDLVINISEGTTRKEEITAGYLLRRTTVDFGVSLVTNVKCGIVLAECFELGLHKGRFAPRHIGEYYKMPTY
jgi:carbamoyl-phosphate synthase large subunit